LYNFVAKVGVKQLDPLPDILFNLELEFAIQKLDIRGNILTKLAQIHAYADEVIMEYKPTKCAFSKLIYQLFYVFYTFKTRGFIFREAVVYRLPSSGLKNEFLNPEEGTDRLSRNVGKELLLFAA
jgi:hypothetical protein